MANFLILVEGETDAWTLWYHGYPALGLPGATNVKCLRAEHIAGFERIIVVAEPDGAGQKFPMLIAEHLRALNFGGPIDTLAIGSSGYKDPSALHCADPLQFREIFDALLKEAQRAPEEPLTIAGPYAIAKDGGTVFHKTIKSAHSEVVSVQELANFHARIVEDIMRDDGVSHERMLTIEAQVDSKAPQTIELPATQFGKMDWCAKLRGGAVICAGQGVRDRMREAIERLSGRARERTIYTHTGWREINGEWIYLHGGGGIGAEGIRVDIEAELPPSLTEFRLPPPPAGAELREALRASAEMIEVGDRAITLPLFGAIWRAALGECDFSVFLIGETGSYKSSLAAVAQRHFGANFNRERLPASWASTANFLENLAFRAKDAILVIDDFRPATHSFDRELQREAERIFRAQGNRSGRGRMNADGSERPTRAPRGMILTTAEEFVWGASLRARMVELEVARGQLSLDKLILLHQAAQAGVLAAAMAGWVQWLASRLPDVRERMTRRAEEIAREFARQAHPRAALALGELQATIELWQEFAEIDLGRVGSVFLGRSETQEEHDEATNEAAKFANILMSTLSNGRAHARTIHKAKPSGEGALGWVLDRTGQFVAQGVTTLWCDENESLWYLDLNTAYALVMGMSNDGNRPNVSMRMLVKLLNEHGYLLRTDNREKWGYRVRKMIDGAQISLLALDGERFGLPRIG